MTFAKVFAGLTRTAANIDTKADNVRRDMFLAVLDHVAGLTDKAEIDKAMRQFNADVRESIRADYSDNVVQEFDSFTSRERAALLAAHTSAAPAFEYSGTAEMERRHQIAAARASEAKRVALYGIAHPDVIEALRAGKITATVALTMVKGGNGGASEGGASEGGADENEADETADDAESFEDKFRANLLSWMQNARKNGKIPAALQIMAEITAEIRAQI